ncbi:hypothetical protein [Planktothrix mougeotii]|uniref:Uncharacterized protein n=1 Tax=Planktothrix mougeotii LEGE 06226 TaxID=1828728 RepID=A0ABR9UK48_9CYAN|nr:hypothetical protein [Planktothrix mougeotii]MBE9146805.1 hypothetical protein [Planktothrix mougeotii LEGE 06226]
MTSILTQSDKCHHKVIVRYLMGKYQIEVKLNLQPLRVIPIISSILGHYGLENLEKC